MIVLIKRMLGVVLLILALPITLALIIGVYGLLSYNTLSGFVSGFEVGIAIVVTIGLIYGFFLLISYLLD